MGSGWTEPRQRGRRQTEFIYHPFEKGLLDGARMCKPNRNVTEEFVIHGFHANYNIAVTKQVMSQIDELVEGRRKDAGYFKILQDKI